MIKRNGLWWAAGLVLSGLLLLIWNFDLLAPYEPWTQIAFAVLLLAIGAGFFSGYLGVLNSWRFIPGWIMVSLVLMVLLSAMPDPPSVLIAAVLFLGVAIAFGHIYLLDRTEHWWALLPAGFTLIIFVLVVATSVTNNIVLLGTLLFIGMGAVFFAVYLLTPGVQQWWALIPGSVLLLFGLLLLTADQENQAGYVRWWPVLFILAGLAVGWFSDSQTAVSSARPISSTLRTTRPRGEVVLPKEAQETSTPLTGQLDDHPRPVPGASVDLLQDANEQ